jgi:NAD(P)-dependent dehydrogenase (short-subunit alcohol dehydrogenase family)
MSGKLEGKIALVIGGSAGIGLGAGKRFALEGARVFITGRRESELEQAAAEIGHDTVPYQADISALADIGRLYRTLAARVSRIDVLFVNAGFYELARFGDVTEEHFDRTFNTNVRGLFFAVQKALPLLARGASVILCGSIAGNLGIEAMSVYDASKAAVRSFARGWILDLKGTGIRVNVLSPGHTDTPGLSRLLTDSQKSDLVARIPLGRLGTPQDLGGAALFLASEESAYITGVELVVDGGVAQY